MDIQQPQEQENVLENVMALFYQGKRIDAQQMLARYLLDHAQDAEAWFTMSTLVEEESRRKQCLERALALRPDYDEAQWALTRLKPDQRPDEDPHLALEAALRDELTFAEDEEVEHPTEFQVEVENPARNGGPSVPAIGPRPKVEALVYPPVKTVTMVLLTFGILISLAMAAGGGYWLSLRLAAGFSLEALTTSLAPVLILVLGVLITILLLVILLRRSAEARVFNRLTKSGRITNGKIDDRWTEWDIEDVVDIYMVSYSFELQRKDGGSDRFAAKQQVSKKLFDRLPPGIEVKIRYLAEDPHVSRLDLHYKY